MKISLRIKNQIVLLILTYIADIYERKHVTLDNRDVPKTVYYTSLETPPRMRKGLRGGGESFVSLAYSQSVD